MGAKNIFTLGFDMGFTGGKTHWHTGHRVPPSEANYTTRFRPAFEKLASKLAKHEVNLYSVTPTHAKVPCMDFADAIRVFEYEKSMGDDQASTPLQG